MNVNKISYIDKSVGLYMRAAYSLSTLRAVVEELVLNAIDADANDIDISINDNKYDVLIRDNGHGISCNDMEKLGEWSITSKSPTTTSHGFRGEALASIISISDITIISRHQGHHTAYSKTFVRGNSIGPCKVSTERFLPTCSGTYIVVSNLFFNMSVRKINMNKNVEASNIKKFIEVMSLLYNSINWQLSDNQKRMIKLSAHKSVYDRFSHLYGSEKSNYLVQVVETFGDYTITGLMSPPLPDFCHWNRDYQFFYVNNRHLKSSDSIVKLVDSCYASALKLDNNKGMISRHHNPNNCHPLFILQLTCCSEFYDVTMEPDKSVILFRSMASVTEIIMRLLTKVFKELVLNDNNNPQYRSMLSLIEKMHKNVKNGNDYKRAIGDYNDDINNDADNKINNNNNNDNNEHYNAIYTLRNAYNDSNDTLRSTWSPQIVNFRSAFLESPDEKFLSSEFAKYSYNNESRYIETEETHQYSSLENSNGNNKCGTSLSLLSEFGVSVRRNDENLYDKILGVYNSYDDAGDDNVVVTDYLANNINNCIDSGNRMNSPSFDIVTDTVDVYHNTPNELQNKESSHTTKPTLNLALSSLSQKRQHDLDKDFLKPSLSEPATKRNKSREDNFYQLGKEKMNLTKEMLPCLRIIGQLNNSVILAMSGDLVVAIDQHAADERIKLESLKIHFPADRNTLELDNEFLMNNLKQVNLDMTIDHYTAAQLESFSEIISSWGFVFKIKEVNSYDNINSNTNNDKDKINNNNNNNNNYNYNYNYNNGENLKKLNVTRVPLIEGDDLSIQDLLEFVHFIDVNPTLPIYACKPPAVTRILNNKACKTAIKFGDKLSIGQCNSIVSDLSTTVFPFQCAHNRPSIAPLINLSPVINDPYIEQTPSIQYSNIMKRIYDL